MREIVVVVVAMFVVGNIIFNGVAGQEPKDAIHIENALCGAKCLYICLGSLEQSPSEFRKLLIKLGKPPKDGFSLKELQDCARLQGCFAESMTIDKKTLQKLSRHYEIILLLKKGHYRHFSLIASTIWALGSDCSLIFLAFDPVFKL